MSGWAGGPEPASRPVTPGPATPEGPPSYPPSYPPLAPVQYVPPPPGPPQAWRPRPYQQLLRGPTLRWWRPMVSVLVAVVLFVCLGGIVLLAGAVLEAQAGLDPTRATQDQINAWTATPAGLLYTNLTLAALIPVVVLATWAGYGWRPRWVTSLGPGVRWGWLLRCYAIALAVLALISVGLQLLAGFDWTPERRWGWLIVVVVVSTPLQAAGEEYLFRGWLPQLVGSVIPNAVVGALLGGAVSSTLFAFAHGQQDGWLFADRFIFGALACWLVWRTGGLEASIAVHGANNIVALVLTIGAGDLSNTLTASKGNPISVAFDVVTLLITVGLLVWAARRTRIVRLFVPPAWAPAPWPPLR